jgi:hypothetical protein
MSTGAASVTSPQVSVRTVVAIADGDRLKMSSHTKARRRSRG